MNGFRTKAACATIAVAVGLAGTAQAVDTGNYETVLTIKVGSTPGVFKGKVKSEKPKCQRNRLVTLYRKLPGPNQAIDTDKSNDEGRYRVTEPMPTSGTWYTRVGKVTKGTTTCKGDRSPDRSAG